MNFEIIHISELESTNDFAFQLIEERIVNEGVIIWADEQIAGRGYGKNKWESEKGLNLTFSLVLKPTFIPPGDQFELTQIVSVALINLLQQIIPGTLLKIKWPNDIYADSKKIAGIFIQNIIRGHDIDFSIVGIGLNVNQLRFHSNASNPVSLIHFLGKEYLIESLLTQLLTEIDKVYTSAMSSHYMEGLRKKYLQNLRNYMEWAAYKERQNRFDAKILGVDQFGRLILQTENGEKRIFDFKEVESVI